MGAENNNEWFLVPAVNATEAAPWRRKWSLEGAKRVSLTTPPTQILPCLPTHPQVGRYWIPGRNISFEFFWNQQKQ